MLRFAQFSNKKKFPLYISVFISLFLFSVLLTLNISPALCQVPDRPGPIVEISATVYEFRYEKETQLGIFYQFNRSRGDFQDSNVFLHGTENVKDLPNRALDLSGSFAKLDYGTIDFNIKTAIQEGWGTVIKNPRITVADGVATSLGSGEEVPLTILQVQGEKTTLKTETRKTGIKLDVTPRIYRKDNLLLNLEIESSEIIRLAVFDRGDRLRFELPVISMRNIKNVVIVPSGKKLYIGGLYTDNTGDLTRKVPIIGDLPGIGFFARGFNKKKSITETVFKITPTIKDPGMGLTFDDSIFSDLLQQEEGQQIIRDQRLIQEMYSGDTGRRLLEDGMESPSDTPSVDNDPPTAPGIILPGTRAIQVPQKTPTPSTPPPKKSLEPTRKYRKRFKLQ